MDSKQCILVIDDRERTVKVVQRVLQKQGFDVLTAFDGLTGLQKARAEKPDLIILDVNMPGMSGHQVYERLQADPNTAGIPVLMLSGQGQDVPATGVVEFLSKPIRAKELIEQVRAMLSTPRGRT